MNTKLYQKFTDTIMQKHYIAVFQLDIQTQMLTEYQVATMLEIRTEPYEEWIQRIAADMHYIEIQPFVEQITLPTLLSALGQEENCYIVSYLIEKNARRYHYRLVACYLDDDKQSILITQQDDSTYMQNHVNKMLELQKDSERFRFIIKHICENFGEINIKDGTTWMTSSNNWEVSQGNLKDQIEWFANNLIVPEQKEAYMKDFELNNFVTSLRKNNGFYAPTYSALYPDGIHHLLIINSLLSNPLNPNEEYIFGFVQDITPLKKQEEKNKQLIDISQQLLAISQIETVTELLNRATGEKMITDYLQKKHSNAPGTLLLLDIDHFKKFNDNYGHMVGDVVLKYISNAMRAIFHSNDVLCRWGGDEFLIFMRDVDDERLIRKQVQQLQKKMNAHIYSSTPLPITLSIGGVIAKQATSLACLFEEADKLLYQVKKQGRNHYIISAL